MVVPAVTQTLRSWYLETILVLALTATATVLVASQHQAALIARILLLLLILILPLIAMAMKPVRLMPNCRCWMLRPCFPKHELSRPYADEGGSDGDGGADCGT